MSLFYTSGIPTWLKSLEQVCFNDYLYIANPIFPKVLKQGYFYGQIYIISGLIKRKTL